MNKNGKSAAKKLDYLEPVWRLIHALTAKQKQDFKKSLGFYSSKPDNLKYLKLFDLVNSCLLIAEKKLNEEIKHFKPLSKDHLGSHFYSIFYEKFARQKAIAPTDLRKVCQYLFIKILESTRYQNETRSKLYDLLTLVKDIQFLTDKDLIPYSKELLSKAKEIAREYSFLEILLYLLRIERMQIIQVQTEQERENLLEKLRLLESEEQCLLKNIARMQMLRSINHETLTFLWQSPYVQFDSIFYNKMEQFRHHFPVEPVDMGLDALIFWNNTMSNFYALAARKKQQHFDFLQGDFSDGIYFHQKKIVEYFWSNPDHANQMLNRMITNFSNLVLRATYLGKHDEELYRKFEALPRHNIPETTFLKTIVYGRFSLFFVDEKRLNQAVDWLETHKIWNLLRIHEHEIPRPNLQNMYFLGGLIYAVHGKWSVAQLWWQHVDNQTAGLSNTESVFTSIWWLHIAQIEQGCFYQHLYPELLLKNLHNKLIKVVPSLDAFDRKLLQIIEWITPLQIHDEQLAKVLKPNLPVLEQLFLENKKKKNMATVMAWLKSKTTKQSFAELLIQHIRQS